MRADATKSEAYAKLVDPATLETFLGKFDESQPFKQNIQRKSLDDLFALINGIIARVDLTEDSHTKALVSHHPLSRNRFLLFFDTS
jgi:hypothetical protein